MATDGCDSTGPGPAGFEWVATYDGWLWQNACDECDESATGFAIYGYPTWCWELIAPGELASLYIGPLGGGGGRAEAHRATPEDFAQLEKLKQAARASGDHR